MPNNDRTGPNGMGSQTGRGAGLCKKSSAPLPANNRSGNKLTRRQGRCWGNGFGRAAQDINSPEAEQQLLSQIQQLQQQLDALRHPANNES